MYSLYNNKDHKDVYGVKTRKDRNEDRNDHFLCLKYISLFYSFIYSDRRYEMPP